MRIRSFVHGGVAVKSIKSRFFRVLLFVAAIIVLVEGTVGTDRAFALTPANVPCGLVGWWPLDGNANDIKNGNNGTVSNGGAFANGVVNKGWKSNGQTSVITVPNAPTLSVTKFTVDFWIKVAALNQGNTVAVWKGDIYGQDGTSPYGILIRGTNAALNSSLPFAQPGTVIVEIGNQNSAQFMQSTSPLPMNKFKHITVTADGSRIRLYIDGSQDTWAFQTVIPVNSSRPLQIGGVANSFYNNTSLNGIIDELELFKRALDPTPKSEIKAIFQAGKLGKCKH